MLNLSNNYRHEKNFYLLYKIFYGFRYIIENMIVPNFPNHPTHRTSNHPQTLLNFFMDWPPTPTLLMDKQIRRDNKNNI